MYIRSLVLIVLSFSLINCEPKKKNQPIWLLALMGGNSTSSNGQPSNPTLRTALEQQQEEMEKERENEQEELEQDIELEKEQDLELELELEMESI